MSRRKGALAEERACAFLERNGFEIIERNFYARYGEIDIIARKSEVLHFIEVKSGQGFEPIFNITPRKLERLTRAIGCYLLTQGSTAPHCLDALIIKGEEIELLENITL